MTGLLRIRGFIELEQFWPSGESDADTTKIQVTVDNMSFAFAMDQKLFKTTHAFEGASVRGTSSRTLIDSKNRITVRLQGIDAPELHYKASALKSKRKDVTAAKRKAYNEANKERRQFLAETATVALAKKLKTFGQQKVKCLFYSLVDEPKQVIDTYGRFVGNIKVGAGFNHDINTWLVQQGWAYPTFYSSMENEEIEVLLNAARKAGKTNVFKNYTANAGLFNPKLLYRGKSADLMPDKDKGPISMPKLFRRQVAYRMEKHAKLTTGTFIQFLQSRPDQCFELNEFLKAGVNTAQRRNLDEFMTGSKFKVLPQEIVFTEKYSTIVDSKNNEIGKF